MDMSKLSRTGTTAKVKRCSCRRPLSITVSAHLGKVLPGSLCNSQSFPSFEDQVARHLHVKLALKRKISAVT